jgi:hypothetical protein
MTSSSHGVPMYRHQCASSSTRAPPASAVCGSGIGRGSAMQRSSCSPLAGGAVLAPAISTADAAVAPALMAALVTLAVETADDYSTGASFALLPNASWLEAFLPLSNMVGGALHTSSRPKSKQNQMT